MVYFPNLNCIKHQLQKQKNVIVSRGVTWVVQLGGGGGGGGGRVSCFARPKGRCGSRARRTFQALINISFPKIAVERGRGASNIQGLLGIHICTVYIDRCTISRFPNFHSC
jgi:hypothetical protein